MGITGSPPTRLTVIPDKWVRPIRKLAGLTRGQHTWSVVLKTFQKILQTTLSGPFG
jgi:hypothetical protein